MKYAMLSIAFLLPCIAFAQMPPPVHATIVTVGHGSITAKSEAGDTVVGALTPATRIEVLSRKALVDLKPGAFVGSGAMTDAGGTLHAQEVHIFAQPGTGEGHRQMGTDPAHTMTNATITKITPAPNGETMTMRYKGGEQTITVSPETPIVTMQPGSLADVKPGMKATLLGRPGAAGTMSLQAILVGRDGAKPPL